MDVQHIETLLASGRIEEAFEEAEKSLPILRDDVKAAIVWGVVNQLSGKPDESERAYRQAEWQCLSWMSTIWTNLAASYASAKEYVRAAELVVELQRYKPFDVALMRQVTWLYIEGKQYDKALDVAREYLKLVPRSPDATRALFVALMANRAFVEALTLSDDIPWQRFMSEGHAGEVSLALCRLGAIAAAKQWLDETVAPMEEARTDFAAAMGGIRGCVGDQQGAVAWLREAVATGCASDGVLAELCLAELALGQFGAALSKLRARRAMGTQVFQPPADLPEWTGQSLAGKTLLILSEQGFGDVIQFLRFVPALEFRGARPVLLTYPDIVRLLGSDDRAKACSESEVGSLHFDYYVELMDLAAGFGLETEQDIPLNIPYLFPSAERVEQWRSRLASGIKIGLVWAGSPAHQEDFRRSANLADFQALSCIPGVTLVLLQKGPQHVEAGFAPPGLNCLDLCCEVRDFADTAAIVSMLDLVISVDTSVVHLAGALGTPVWMLNAADYRDWRWGHGKSVAPWYPSVRVFEQEKAYSGNWARLVSHIVRPALLDWIESRQPAVADLPVWRALFADASDADVDGCWAAAGVPLRDLADLACFRYREFKDSRLLGKMAGMRDSDDPHVIRSQAMACFSAGDGEHGVAILGAFLGRMPTDIRQTNMSAILSACFELLIAELLKLDRLDDGARWCTVALKSFERNERLHYWQAYTAFRQKRPVREQLELAERAVSLGRRNVGAKYLLVHLLSEIDERGETRNFSRRCQLLQECISIDPYNMQAWRAIAAALRERGASRMAARILMAVHERDSSLATDLYLADLHVLAGDTVAARELVEGTTEKELGGAENQLALAQALRGIGEYSRATEVFSRLVSEIPDFREAHFHFGWHLLSLGDCRLGWREYSMGMKEKPSIHPEWDGSALCGRSLLVWQDQGSGDMLQFADVLRDISDGNVTLVVSSPLVPFLNAQKFPFRIIDHATAEREHLRFDFQIAQMKALQYLDVNLKSPRRVGPYYFVDKDRLPGWRDYTGADSRLKVGIVWAGNPGYGNDYYRSSVLDDWRALASMKHVSLYSFQKDVASNQARFAAGYDIKNIVIDCDGWLDTASALQLMDIVISVDSGVAHLAAALGQKTWILLAHRVTDYRWMIDREDCPWYPSATLIRQLPGEPWAEVIGRVADRLAHEYGFPRD